MSIHFGYGATIKVKIGDEWIDITPGLKPDKPETLALESGDTAMAARIPKTVKAILNPLVRFLLEKYREAGCVYDQDNYEQGLAEMGYVLYIRPYHMTVEEARKQSPWKDLIPVMEFEKALQEDVPTRPTKLILMRHKNCLELEQIKTVQLNIK